MIDPLEIKDIIITNDSDYAESLIILDKLTETALFRKLTDNEIEYTNILANKIDEYELNQEVIKCPICKIGNIKNAGTVNGIQSDGQEVSLTQIYCDNCDYCDVD